MFYGGSYVVYKKLRIEQPPTGQCCHPHDEVSLNEHYRKHRRERMAKLNPSFDPTLCGRKAAYELDGKQYCSIHAGQRALEILIDKIK